MKPLLLCSMVFFLSGFRVMPYKWNISTEQPTLWIKFDSEHLSSDFDEIDFGNDIHPAEFAAAGQQRQVIIDEIFADFNNINTAFVRLAYHPIDGLDLPEDPLDTSFDADVAEKRIITVKVGSSGNVAAAGSALPQPDPDNDDYLGSCKIQISKEVSKDAKNYKTTLTHEIGHCLGLVHNHADYNAIMGYNSTTHSLDIDDQMGVTYLYPTDPGYADEAMTLGMSCARK